ncbi:plasmid mobilization protein [Phreatobacter sp.]|uniref:plasmid mobilization protein n=1 Tax=Phreatobacter sp. TaxID=1966341 RepID=UPI003F6F926A
MTRAPKVQKKRTAAPLSIRFTDAEKALLKEKAGDVSVGAYIRQTVLEGDSAPRRTRKSPLRDAEPLGRLLALLGQSRLANNLNQIAKGVNQGSLPVSPEVEADLRQACADVFEMRSLLVRALGLKIVEEAIQSAAPPLAPVFAAAAGGDDQPSPFAGSADTPEG